MTIRLLEREFPTDHLPLLRWLMFTGVTAFGFVIAWHYGLFHLMLASDKTYISADHRCFTWRSRCTASSAPP